MTNIFKVETYKKAIGEEEEEVIISERKTVLAAEGKSYLQLLTLEASIIY